MKALGIKHKSMLSLPLLLTLAALITPIKVIFHELEKNLIVIQISKVSHSIVEISDDTEINDDRVSLLERGFYDLTDQIDDNILIWYHLGQIAYWSGEYEKVIFVLAPQLKDKQFPLASLILGSAFWEMDKLAQATSSWKPVKNIENYFLIQASIAESERNYLDAEENYQKLIALSPDRAEAISGYQFVQSINLLSDPDSDPLTTEAIVNQALSQNGDSATRQLRLGVALYQANSFKLAKVALQRAIQLEPKSHWPRYYLGLVYFSEKDYFHAKEKLLESVEITPNHARGHHWLARTMIKLGESDLALHHYRLAVNLLPDDPALVNEASTFIKNIEDSR